MTVDDEQRRAQKKVAVAYLMPISAISVSGMAEIQPISVPRIKLRTSQRRNTLIKPLRHRGNYMYIRAICLNITRNSEFCAHTHTHAHSVFMDFA
jgi:hypothetical protein